MRTDLQDKLSALFEKYYHLQTVEEFLKWWEKIALLQKDELPMRRLIRDPSVFDKELREKIDNYKKEAHFLGFFVKMCKSLDTVQIKLSNKNTQYDGYFVMRDGGKKYFEITYPSMSEFSAYVNKILNKEGECCLTIEESSKELIQYYNGKRDSLTPEAKKKEETEKTEFTKIKDGLTFKLNKEYNVEPILILVGSFTVHLEKERYEFYLNELQRLCKLHSHPFSDIYFLSFTLEGEKLEKLF